jgi:hypothetical protein
MCCLNEAPSANRTEQLADVVMVSESSQVYTVSLLCNGSSSGQLCGAFRAFVVEERLHAGCTLGFSAANGFLHVVVISRGKPDLVELVYDDLSTIVLTDASVAAGILEILPCQLSASSCGPPPSSLPL